MKKKWIVVIVLVIVAVGVAAYFIGQGGFKSEEEKLVEELTKPLDVSVPKGHYIETLEAKGKIEVGKAEVDKEALGIGTFDFEVEVTNQSNQVLEYGELAYTIYDGDGQLIGETNRVRPGTKIRNLGPGEIITLHSQSGTIGIGVFREVSKFEYTLRNLQWSSEESASLPEQTEEEQIEEEQSAEGNVYTASNYPKNPQTPAEVVAAFYFLYNNKKYSEAEKLLAQECRQRAQSRGGLENFYEETFQGRQLKKVEVGETEIVGNRAQVFSTVLYYADGSKESPNDVIFLEKENGRWKIAM